jgi:hypothetical protein
MGPFGGIAIRSVFSASRDGLANAYYRKTGQPWTGDPPKRFPEKKAKI